MRTPRLRKELGFIKSPPTEPAQVVDLMPRIAKKAEERKRLGKYIQRYNIPVTPAAWGLRVDEPGVEAAAKRMQRGIAAMVMHFESCLEATKSLSSSYDCGIEASREVLEDEMPWGSWNDKARAEVGRVLDAHAARHGYRRKR